MTSKRVARVCQHQLSFLSFRTIAVVVVVVVAAAAADARMRGIDEITA